MPLYRLSTRPGCYGANNWHSSHADSGAASPCILVLKFRLRRCQTCQQLHVPACCCCSCMGSALAPLPWSLAKCQAKCQHSRPNSTVAVPAHDTVPDCLTGCAKKAQRECIRGHSGQWHSARCRQASKTATANMLASSRTLHLLPRLKHAAGPKVARPAAMPLL